MMTAAADHTEPGAAGEGFAVWSARVQQRMELRLAQMLPDAGRDPMRLHAAMRYAVLEGGKRVRPLLAFAAGELTGAREGALDHVACALELIHAYSLVHDDMPCMDDDTLRRGKPTVHVEYDEATALLVGDALQSLAFDLVSVPGLLPEAGAQLALVHQLARAAGAAGMAGGQAIDLDAVGRTLSLPELERMHIHKTGALIRASVVMGALCGTADARMLERLDRYARCVGLAFQVVDDVLDADGTTASLGKTAGKDAQDNKPTYVSILGIGPARELAGQLCAQALEAAGGLGPGARRLVELARFIVGRTF
jgi:farnesyl diphosphate synthase